MGALAEMPFTLTSRSVRTVIREIRQQPLDVRTKKRMVIEWFDYHEMKDNFRDVLYQSRTGSFVSPPKDRDEFREWKRRIFEEVIGLTNLSRTLG